MGNGRERQVGGEMCRMMHKNNFKKDSPVPYFCFRENVRGRSRSHWRSRQSGTGYHSTGEGQPVGVVRDRGRGRPAGGDTVRGLGSTAGGIRVGEGDRLAGAGRAGGGRRTALGGLVVGGGPSPGVGRDGAVGAGGQEVVPAAEEEEVAAF